MTEAPPAGGSSRFNPASAVLLALILFTLILAVISLPAGVYGVFFTSISPNATALTSGTPYLFVGPYAFLLPFQVTYGVAFLACIAVYSAMLLLLVFQGKSPQEAARSSLSGDVSEILSSRLFLAIVSIGFLVFTAAMINVAVKTSGGSIGNPLADVDPLKELVQLTLAPIREEFGFRVLTIGVLAMVLSAARPLRSAVVSVWRPSAAYEGVAAGGAFAAVWMATGASSVVFGVCHVACGGGWDIGKLPEATYGGAVLGYLYVKYGFHVAVLGHWGVNYLWSVFAFVGQGAYGIPWGSEGNSYVLQRLVIFDLIYLIGIASFLLVVYLGLTKLFGRQTYPKQVDSSYPGPQAVAEGGA